MTDVGRYQSELDSYQLIGTRISRHSFIRLCSFIYKWWDLCLQVVRNQCPLFYLSIDCVLFKCLVLGNPISRSPVLANIIYHLPFVFYFSISFIYMMTILGFFPFENHHQLSTLSLSKISSSLFCLFIFSPMVVRVIERNGHLFCYYTNIGYLFAPLLIG